MVQGRRPPPLIKVEVLRGGLPPGATFQEILLIRISIIEAQVEGSPKISKEKAATTALNALHLINWSHLCGGDN